MYYIMFRHLRSGGFKTRKENRYKGTVCFLKTGRSATCDLKDRKTVLIQRVYTEGIFFKKPAVCYNIYTVYESLEIKRRE